MDKTSKEAKEVKESKTPTSQEHTSSTNTGTVNPEWSGFQAYSPMPQHGFLASSPQAYPYMWGVQHLMPPYGTPPHPYVTMYPYGGIYAHPSIPPGSYPFSPFAMPSPNGIAQVSGNTPGSMEVDGKPSEGKEKLPIKRSKGSMGSLNIITSKNNEPGKTSGASANGASSKSAESASDASSEGSDASSQNDSQIRSGNRHDSSQGEGFRNGNTVHSLENGGPNAPNSMVNQTMSIIPVSTAGTEGEIPGPTTNLNIGMDYWGTATSSPILAMRGKVHSAPLAGAMVNAKSGDERELKRQRRKHSNRESARRSRLRKQAGYDELAQRTEALIEENASLRADLNCIRSEYEQLVDQNASLRERLGEVPGQEDPSSGQNDQHIGNHTQQSLRS